MDKYNLNYGSFGQPVQYKEGGASVLYRRVEEGQPRLRGLSTAGVYG